jgi:hypothetical protein
MNQNSSSEETLTRREFIAIIKDFKTQILTKMEELELHIEDKAREKHSEVLTKLERIKN